ncbi:holo-ACP synthase, partial [Streptomyces sp. NPDC127079]
IGRPGPLVAPERGRPRLGQGGRGAPCAAELGVRSWHVSLSHDAGVASAVVIAEG